MTGLRPDAAETRSENAGELRSPFRAWLELMRLSNAPTIITNVLVGCAAAGAAASGGGDLPPGGTIVMVCAAMLLMYAGGMAMNDAFDASIDAIERPSRPIPSGRVGRSSAWVFAAGSLGAGIGLCALLSRPAFILSVVLAASIVAYNAVHRLTACSVALMGLCRGLVPVVACAAVTWPLPWELLAPPALGMATYVTLLSVMARREAAGSIGQRAWLAWLLLPAALLPGAAVPEAPWESTILPGVLLVGWWIYSTLQLKREPRRIGRAILGWLAGICLVDAVYLALLGEPGLVVAAAGCFVITALAQQYIQGT
jgi:4-hydroxybenzoate polyprenyltransferase